MKVPTFRKYGITKAQLRSAESRDKKISDILTHHLTIGIGIAFGMVVYVLYFNKVQPDNFIQIVTQVFIFASLGIICIGVPALLFKLAEMYYIKQRSRTDEHKVITKYNEERDNYEFWKIRKDFSFWNMMDGLSFEKEVMNIYLHLGYEDKAELNDENFDQDRILSFGDKLYYFTFYTKITEFNDTSEIDKLLERKNKSNCDLLHIYSAKGFHKSLNEFIKDKPVNLFDINGIIKVVRTIKN
ncbi:MAG TPA: hypothetical protein PKE39_09200 [Ignavibacteria bacterium]|nr:hypothetical protein [Ignavibacteria bacterium]HMQ99187.1 hypothetical protein [Ignavibacteria bacterium]